MDAAAFRARTERALAKRRRLEILAVDRKTDLHLLAGRFAFEHHPRHFVSCLRWDRARLVAGRIEVSSGRVPHAHAAKDSPWTKSFPPCHTPRFGCFRCSWRCCGLARAICA